MTRVCGLWAGLVLFILGGCAGVATFHVTETYEHRFATDRPVELDIELRNGGAEIRAAEDGSDEIELKVTVSCGGRSQAEAMQRLEATDLIVALDDAGRLVLRADFPTPRYGRDSVNVVARLPRSDGGRVRTSNGAIILHGLAGALTARTSNGRVKIIDHDGPVDVRTSNGNIVLRNVAGSVDANSSNGGLVAKAVGTPARLTTSNGRIELELRPDAIGPIELRTSNGSINAAVGPAFAGRMNMQTSNGGIRISDPLGLVRSPEISARRAVLAVGDGGDPDAESRLRTSNGRITFRVIE